MIYTNLNLMGERITIERNRLGLSKVDLASVFVKRKNNH